MAIDRNILSGRRLPAALIDLDAFDRNLAHVERLARAKGKRVRVATKALRVPEMIRRVLEHSETFTGLMCYSAEEALLLSREPWLSPRHDLLVAYPTVQDSDFEALMEIGKSGRTIRLIVDHENQIRALADFFKRRSVSAEAATRLSLMLEIDASLRPLGLYHIGVMRSPVRTIRQAVRFIQNATKNCGVPTLKVDSVMMYEGPVAGLGDRNPFKPLLNPIFGWIRKWALRRTQVFRRNLAKELNKQGITLRVFNGGGTGSLNWAVEEPALTEVTMGSGLFCPHLFDYFSNIRFEPAAYFGLQVVRSSDPGFVTCAGGGYIASGEPSWDRVPIPAVPAGSKLVTIEGCSEVQTPVRVGSEVALGSPILFRHAKAGELFERFNEALLVSGGKIIQSVPTYRGRGWCFF